VRFERNDEHGSRSHARAFDVILEGNSGRRANFGGTHEAATWDEWGIFLNSVFDTDPEAKTSYYKNEDDFHWQTNGRFEFLTVADAHKSHKWEFDGMAATGSYSVQSCKCGALKRCERD
jgi:hypothetical protein